MIFLLSLIKIECSDAIEIIKWRGYYRSGITSVISVEYVLAAPEFRPQRAVDRAAALDVRAYLPDILELDLLGSVTALLNEYTGCSVYINGQKVEGAITQDLLTQAEPHSRFLVLAPGTQKIVSAGFKVGLSTDDPMKIAAMLVCPRSGLACKNSITVINSPGIVDEHYPDWVGICLVNHGQDIHLFSHGARIAQVMFIEVCVAQESVVTELTTIGERKGGFGHTGV